MRRAKNAQGTFNFQPATLRITNEYHERYRQIDGLLGAAPQILQRAHADIKKQLEHVHRQRNRPCRYTSENVLRLVICQAIEGASLREIVVRVDDSNFLREFCRFGMDRMMGHTLFCSLRNAITPATWDLINQALTTHAVAEKLITGDMLRVDTTACETNIHFPTDASLLWDVHRTMARLIRKARGLGTSPASNCRIHDKKAKRIYVQIHRVGGKKTKAAALKRCYETLLGLVSHALDIGRQVVFAIRSAEEEGGTSFLLAQEIEHFSTLGDRIVNQTKRRVINGEAVPNNEKLFSIFEPHTELLIRGKAGKNIEFGHMVLFAQTQEKFITDFKVFPRKPNEHALVDGILKRHSKLFGSRPSTFAADKGFYESADKLTLLEKSIEVVAIAKKGKRTPAEDVREHSLAFKLGQAFRSGIEGTISFVKRCLRLHRCFNKGWKHYEATVGATVFAHNLLILARGKT